VQSLKDTSPEDLAKAAAELSPEEKAKLLAALGAGSTQGAFVFVKPHANTEKMNEVVKAEFAKKGIKILKEGSIDGPTIDKEKYIDNHYYAIASKATINKPKDLNVPKDKFKEFFGEEWDDVIKEGEERAYNALDLKAKLEWSDETLNEKWDAGKGKRIKFGGGFYCQLMEVEKDGATTKYYTFNAFFMEMRSKFTTADAKIQYYSVEWDPAALSWADFRGKVLGPTDPAAAPAESLRGMLHANWEAYGLKAAPNTGDNGVHASASPFEGLAERNNWLQVPFADDPFGKKLIEAGIDGETLKKWSVDPQAPVPGEDGKTKSLFDQVEDSNLDECISKLKAIYEAGKKA